MESKVEEYESQIAQHVTSIDMKTKTIDINVSKKNVKNKNKSHRNNIIENISGNDIDIKESNKLVSTQSEKLEKSPKSHSKSRRKYRTQLNKATKPKQSRKSKKYSNKNTNKLYKKNKNKANHKGRLDATSEAVSCSEIEDDSSSEMIFNENDCESGRQYKVANNNNIDRACCYVCGSYGDESNCLLCDHTDSLSLRCYNACHWYCHDPPFSGIPSGDWFCLGVFVCCVCCI